MKVTHLFLTRASLYFSGLSIPCISPQSWYFSKLTFAKARSLIAACTLIGMMPAPLLAETTEISSEPLWSSSFKSLAGSIEGLSTYQGKVLVVYFWATWCEPCQREGPALQALYQKFKSKNFSVVGIAVDNADKVREFVQKKGMDFPVLYGGNEAIKLSKDVGNSFGGIPYLVVLDQNGKVTERIIGETKDGQLEGIIVSLLDH